MEQEKLMDESNQTEEERRELRMQQRALKQEVIEQRAVSAGSRLQMHGMLTIFPTITAFGITEWDSI